MVCARNSQRQDDRPVALRGPQPSVRWQREQVDETADTSVLSKRRGTKRRLPVEAFCLLVADSCEALVDEPLTIAPTMPSGKTALLPFPNSVTTNSYAQYGY